jgi:hydroxymethylpyrimidine pyrophosphatase-like HAD family hydrolase
LLGQYAELVQRPQIIIDSYDVVISQYRAIKIVILTNDATALIDAAYKEFGDNEFNIVRGSPYPFFVEFLLPTTSKGVGLQHMCEHLGVDAANVAAFGDGDNDKEMLLYAGLGIAMHNAKTEAKNAADIILEV